MLPQTSPTGRSPAEVSATLRLIQSYAIAQPQATHPKSSSQRTLECFFFERNSGSVFLNTWYCVIQKCLNEKNTLTWAYYYIQIQPTSFRKGRWGTPSTILLVHFGHFFTRKKNTRMSTRKLGSMVRINGLFHLLMKWGIPWGWNNPLIRSALIHPNFRLGVSSAGPF